MRHIGIRNYQGVSIMKKMLCYLPVLLLVALLSACGDTPPSSTRY